MVSRSAILGLILFWPVFMLIGCAPHNYAPVADLERPAPKYWGTHVVKRGETLYSIAWRYGRDYRDLARINGISRPYTIKAGQRISLHSKPSTKTKSKQVAQVKKKPVQTSKSVTASPAPVSRTIVWRWPVKGKVIKPFISKGVNNKGIDIKTGRGAPVVAAADGTVVYAGNGLIGYGNLIIIKHNEQYLSAYAHNRKILVQEKKSVKAGQKIAETGSMGGNISQLHFEIRRKGKPVNPLQYLPKTQS